MDHLLRGSLSFALLFVGACGDECMQDPTAYAFDEPGPWGETPEEVFGEVEDPVSGTLTWMGPLIEEQIDPSMAETAVTLELTLDTSSSMGVPNSLVGPCDGQLEIDATLSIVTADGALDESMSIVLRSGPGSNYVNATVDLTSYEFAGTFELAPGWSKDGMRLLLSWDRNGGLTGGTMLTGDASFYAVIL